jgi:hypothetical protein
MLHGPAERECLRVQAGNAQEFWRLDEIYQSRHSSLCVISATDTSIISKRKRFVRNPSVLKITLRN